MVTDFSGGHAFGPALDQQAKDVKASLLRKSGQGGDDVSFSHDSIYMKISAGCKLTYSQDSLRGSCSARMLRAC